MTRFCLAALFLMGAARMTGDAGALCQQGKLAVWRGDYAAASELFEQAVALAPQKSEYAHWLGNSYAWAAATAPLSDKPALGRKCLAAYRQAIALDPDNLPARFSLMNFYRRVPRLFGGGLARAGDQADEIGRRDPLQGAYARAVLLGDEKEYAEAFSVLAGVLRQNPSHYAANFLLGRLALESGERKAEGEAAFRRCLELTPSENDERHEAVTRCLEQLAGQRNDTVVARR